MYMYIYTYGYIYIYVCIYMYIYISPVVRSPGHFHVFFVLINQYCSYLAQIIKTQHQSVLCFNSIPMCHRKK